MIQAGKNLFSVIWKVKNFGVTFMSKTSINKLVAMYLAKIISFLVRDDYPSDMKNGFVAVLPTVAAWAYTNDVPSAGATVLFRKHIFRLCSWSFPEIYNSFFFVSNFLKKFDKVLKC